MTVNKTANLRRTNLWMLMAVAVLMTGCFRSSNVAIEEPECGALSDCKGGKPDVLFTECPMGGGGPSAITCERDEAGTCNWKNTYHECPEYQDTCDGMPLPDMTPRQCADGSEEVVSVGCLCTTDEPASLCGWDVSRSGCPADPITSEQCKRSGCSGQLCIPASVEDVATTCEWRPEYACLAKSDCVFVGEVGCMFIEHGASPFQPMGVLPPSPACLVDM